MQNWADSSIDFDWELKRWYRAGMWNQSFFWNNLIQGKGARSCAKKFAPFKVQLSRMKTMRGLAPTILKFQIVGITSSVVFTITPCTQRYEDSHLKYDKNQSSIEGGLLVRIYLVSQQIPPGVLLTNQLRHWTHCWKYQFLTLKMSVRIPINVLMSAMRLVRLTKTVHSSLKFRLNFVHVRMSLFYTACLDILWQLIDEWIKKPIRSIYTENSNAWKC